MSRCAHLACLVVWLAARPAFTEGPTLPHPILFVTQAPWPMDFATVNATFGNHRAGMEQAPRGGDLWIRYGDGTLRNLTRDAGLGVDGFQGKTAIAVRDPSVHWDGKKALFSMLTGAPALQHEVIDVRWQIHEISGLGAAETPVVTRLANQPAGYNNVSPIYASDDRILFTSDRPRGGEPHLYPQLDEYERTPTVSGLWSLHPASGELRLLDHAPSGDFTPIVDSFGRVIFTRWDHLERDQLADADAGPVSNCFGGTSYGTITYASEAAAAPLVANLEVFPEPRGCRNDLLAGTNLEGHGFNHFFPWMIRQDGAEAETLNHIGRHELFDYMNRAINDDPNVKTFAGPGNRANQNRINSLFQIKEDPTAPGSYLGIDAPEFGTHASGQVVRLLGHPALNADQMTVTYVTHRDTSSYTDTPGPDHTGHYRDPLPLSDGKLVAAHAADTREDRNTGSATAPGSRYDYRLRTLALLASGFQGPGAALTPGIQKTLSWWGPLGLTSYSGLLWELQPVELRARPRPAVPALALESPEAAVFGEEGVDPAVFRSWLAASGLAVIVSRNVTTRDAEDRQQPFNLRVAGGTAQTLGAGGKIYDVAHLEIYQGDQVRGTTGCCGSTPLPGKRVLARELHDPAAVSSNPPDPGGPAGAVKVAADGSLAAFVPARRALTWQLVAPDGTALVRERFWLTFQPGEVRVCASCHGTNATDQAGKPAPQNKPEALRKLLAHWKTLSGPQPPIFADVPPGYWAKAHVETIYLAGLTGGCQSSPLKLFCPESSVRRAEMVVFLLRALHGPGYAPPDLPATRFLDVPGSYWSADWIEQAAAEGLTGGCGSGAFCPEAAITRAQMAVFLLRALHGPAYAPPAATGQVFGDVGAAHWAAAWIEELAAEGITGGCGGVDFCPEALVTRAQMAVFLTRAFAIPLR